MTSSPLPAVPHGQTARRVEWQFLPPHVRDLIAERCGSPVISAESMGGGFTPGFASVLTCEDGSRHFVKAAATKAQKLFAASYREEARKVAALADCVPAPRLLWVHDQDWVVLGFEHVEGRAPARPWRADELNLLLDALEVTSAATPPPGLGLDPMIEEFSDWPACWDFVRVHRPDLPHADEAAALALRFAEALSGSSLQHTDIRDDNAIITADDTLWICDWNWPVLGAPWFDTLTALIGPRGDGIDVAQILTERRLTRDVPDEHIDIALALLAGYLLKSATDPVPSTSPHIRDHQAQQGQVVWDWLSERRAWT